MKEKKIPLRMCVVTKERLPKKELIRIVRDNSGNVQIDETGRANGRGAYLKKELGIIEQVRRNRILDKHLDIEVPDSIFDKLKAML